MTKKVSKTWCFTLNNYTDQDIQFFKDIEVTYLVCGQEGGAPVSAPLDDPRPRTRLDQERFESQSTPHLQGYIIFKRAYWFAQLKKLHKRTHWEAALAKDAMNYCMKDQNYILRDNRTPGKRNDFAEKAEIILQHKTKRAMVTDPRLYSTVARYGSWASLIHSHRTPMQVDVTTIVLKPWQKVLMEIIFKSPHPRQVHWWYDQVGGQGKSFMTNLLCRNHQAFLACGKKADCLYAYKDSLATIVIFDLTRSQDGEFTPYSTMETIKNGLYLSTKYQSVPVLRDTACHLIVFANFRPDRSKLSEDRWDVHVLGSIF